MRILVPLSLSSPPSIRPFSLLFSRFFFSLFFSCFRRLSVIFCPLFPTSSWLYG